MRILSSRSSRFQRSLNYTMPEYRPAAPQGQKTRIALVAPTGTERNADSPSHRGESQG